MLDESTRGKRPDYYLQNFHYQSGGWLTDDSAQRYDTKPGDVFEIASAAFGAPLRNPLALSEDEGMVRVQPL